MILTSAALVLVALVLLAVGLAGTGLAAVYASIAVSVLAILVLLLGIYQRRDDPPAALPADGGEDSAAHPVPASDTDESLTPRRPAHPPVAAVEPTVAAVEPEPPVEDDADLLGGDADPLAGDDEGFNRLVLVVAGRPRYHVEGCPYLSGRPVEGIDVLDAREEGFTPCRICTPDAVLAGEPEDDQ